MSLLQHRRNGIAETNPGGREIYPAVGMTAPRNTSAESRNVRVRTAPSFLPTSGEACSFWGRLQKARVYCPLVLLLLLFLPR